MYKKNIVQRVQVYIGEAKRQRLTKTGYKDEGTLCIMVLTCAGYQHMALAQLPNTCTTCLLISSTSHLAQNVAYRCGVYTQVCTSPHKYTCRGRL